MLNRAQILGHLNDLPDWRYLLLEGYVLYRFLDSDGSDQSRSHQKSVREAISRVIMSNPESRADITGSNPITKHLRRSLDEGKHQLHASVVSAFESIHEHLNREHGYEKMPRSLESKFNYAQICGPKRLHCCG